MLLQLLASQHVSILRHSLGPWVTTSTLCTRFASTSWATALEPQRIFLLMARSSAAWPSTSQRVGRSMEFSEQAHANSESKRSIIITKTYPSPLFPNKRTERSPKSTATFAIEAHSPWFSHVQSNPHWLLPSIWHLTVMCHNLLVSCNGA